MNLFNQWMQSDLFQALGWTFVHSLWQIALIGLSLYVILRLIPGRSAHVRYTISTLAIWSIVIAALSTFIIMLPVENNKVDLPGAIVVMNTTSSLSLAGKLSLWLEQHMPMMLTVWLGGVVILMVRLLFSIGWISHIRSSSIPSATLQESLNNIIHKLHLNVRPVVSDSGHISSPVTIGHLKPLILFPIGIVNQLTPAEVEAILTHELAHIVRRDYLSNLIQSFIETLFYYHPVTWWISRIVRTERENRADDLAVSWCGDHLAYAKALMTVQEMQADMAPSLAIGFSSPKGLMLARIQRILHIPYKNHNQMEKTVLLSLCSLCFLAFTITGEAKTDETGKNENPITEIIDLINYTTDTIPATGTYRIHKKTDDQEISIEVEDGDIKELEIDGKEIAPAQYDQYEDVIEELFGGVESPPSMEGFHFEMAPMPPLPGLPYLDMMPAMPPMPPLPPMPPMGEMEMRFYEGNIGAFGNGENQKYIIRKRMEDGKEIIIIQGDGDSSKIIDGQFEFHHLPAIEMEKFMMNADQWEKHASEWKKQSKEWEKHGKEWEKMSEDWKKNWEEQSEEWQHEWRSQNENLEQHLERSFDQRQLQELHLDDRLMLRQEEFEAMEHALGERELAIGRVYGLRGPRINMGDALIEEGLVAPGEDALIQLTPEKLKINGKKMDAETHQKYLRMYESQQGVELSGNSRIEFRIKSRVGM